MEKEIIIDDTYFEWSDKWKSVMTQRESFDIEVNKIKDILKNKTKENNEDILAEFVKNNEDVYGKDYDNIYSEIAYLLNWVQGEDLDYNNMPEWVKEEARKIHFNICKKSILKITLEKDNIDKELINESEHIDIPKKKKLDTFDKCTFLFMGILMIFAYFIK